MGIKQDSVKNLAVFREQCRRAIAAYVHERSRGHIKYLTLTDHLLKRQGSIQQGASNAVATQTYFSKEEFETVSRLIVATECEISQHDARDKIHSIYRTMPKLFSFFFPLVTLSDRLSEILAKYPREKLLEIELEDQREQMQSCDTKIRHLTEEYGNSVKLCESLSEKVKEISSVDRLEKLDLKQRLESAQLQCQQYQQSLLKQQQNALLLGQQNQKLIQENHTLTQQVEKLLKTNQQLQESLQTIQISYKDLKLKYDACPIKSQDDLSQLKEEILEEMVQRLSPVNKAMGGEMNSRKVNAFSTFSKQF